MGVVEREPERERAAVVLEQEGLVAPARFVLLVDREVAETKLGALEVHLAGYRLEGMRSPDSTTCWRIPSQFGSWLPAMSMTW